MQTTVDPIPRRTQFSSCDACRHSRLACDAARIGSGPGKPGWSGSCSRCRRRKRPCTFEWMNNAKKAGGRGPRKARTPPLKTVSSEQSSLSPEARQRDAENDAWVAHSESAFQGAPDHVRSLSTESPSIVAAPASYIPLTPPFECTTSSVGDWLERIYESCFDNVFGFWMGRHACALVADPNSSIISPPSGYFSELDESIFGDWGTRNQLCNAQSPRHTQLRWDQIDQSLRHAKRSFAARWFHLIPPAERAGILPEHIVREFWRRSRRDMLKVVNRVSYRSALTLFLFSLTPVPVGISEDEEMDGLSGQLCVQAALQQIQRLREGQRNCQFSGSMVAQASDPLTSPAASSRLSDSFLRTEARAYWAALTFDTSSSLTLNLRSTLTSGLHGADTESCWRTLRMGAGSFHTRTEDWRRNPFSMTEDEVLQAIAAAAATKLYVWKMISVLKEALREGSEDEKVLRAWTSFTEAIEIFRVTFRPLLNDCERRLPFLGQVEKLNWYELMLHYYMGILILVDALEVAERDDLLSQLTDIKLEAEHQVFSALKFGLESKYTVFGSHQGGSTMGAQNSNSDQKATASFVALDPYPHHVVAAAQLMGKVVSRQYRQGQIKWEAYKYLNGTLLKCLAELPQTSKSVQAARQNLEYSLTGLENTSNQLPYSPLFSRPTVER
ncbi:uncharacterized protein PV07_02561 [Cladophialophora immunda]|uniref:Zn(2)-C6 fungal-type domain-containing protein n=1 Tax=Cladophialophora immunda TaxID=569365 RepID=A0A0D2CI97_9EURO|nr:uncharacterized protein PV07_02561 [Cladophialophora immunda]KIW30868.1 hypothetical protein PV07_02561 [Cladophialophora immunda]OQV02203.1 hypothetical protein CLAIMM_07439 [Cladophialophora immunda]